jgi:inner membrane transporter RhtA
MLVLAAISSVQFGGALAKSLFDEIGPGGTVLLRVLLAAVILAAFWRPSLRGHSAAEWRLIALFGVSLAAMNLSFYESLDRIPLGIAVTIEFVGPLGVALAGSRRAFDLVWVGLAAAGILLLSDFGTADLDRLGVALALLAGGFWAAYILLSVRVGSSFPGGNGLALAMVLAATMLVPVGVADAGGELLVPWILAAGLAVSVRGDDEHRAGDGGPRRLHRAGRGPRHARAGCDPARGGRQCRGGAQCARAAAGRLRTTRALGACPPGSWPGQP